MSDKQPVGWNIINEKTPQDNSRNLYIAEIRNGELIAIDCYATYQWNGDKFLYSGDSVAISTPTHWAYQDEPLPTITHPVQPAPDEKDAEIARLRVALEKLARLGNGEEYGNSLGNAIAIEALNYTTGEQS